MEAQNMAFSADNKVIRPASSSPSPTAASRGHSNNGGIVHSWDCAICYESLMKPGPPLECFTFGKLLINLEKIPFLEREHIYREFQLYDQCFVNGKFDCDKALSTVCGHLFHSGCIREWFFMRRLDINPKCPFCKRPTCYEECRVLHPVCSYNEDTDEDGKNKEEEADAPVTFNETEYSDISCTSSSWPSDNENNDSEEEINVDELDLQEDENAEEPIVLNQEHGGGVEDQYPYEEGEDSEDQAYYEGDEEEEEEEEEASDSVRVPLISVDDDDILYYPTFVASRDREINNFGKEKPGKTFNMLGMVRTCNLVHIVTLLEVIKAWCQIFHTRKQNFLLNLELTIDNSEDEYLTDIDHESLVPLGYPFVLFCFLVWLIIWTAEVFADFLTLKMTGKYKKSATKFTYMHGILCLLSSGCLLLHYLVGGLTAQRK